METFWMADVREVKALWGCLSGWWVRPLFSSSCPDRANCFGMDGTMSSSSCRKFLHQAVALVVSAMAFQPGRYAVEAGGAEPDAESNLLQLRIARVWEFREKNLLLADEDFAYACATFAGGNYLG